MPMLGSGSASTGKAATGHATPDLPMGRWPLMAREQYLANCVEALADRRVSGYMIYGPAGVGKSRLAQECVDRASRDGARVRRAQATAAAAQVPLGAIAHLIPDSVDLSDPTAGFAAVARAFHRASAKRTIVLVDDIHLLDVTSAVLLRQLMDAGAVFLVATRRVDEPANDAVVALQAGDLTRRVDLSELTLAETDSLLSAVFNRPLSRRAVHRLHTVSQGNVLYLRELVLGALTRGALVDDGEIWHLVEDQVRGTPQLRELIDSHIAAAGQEGRDLLDLLAVCERISAVDASATAPAGVVAELEARGLVNSTVAEDRTDISLSHPLFATVLRDGLTPLRTRSLLLDQIRRVESRGSLRREDALAVASWRLTAEGTADPDLLVQASVTARHTRDYDQVVSLLHALPDEHHHTMTRLLLGEALFQTGRVDEAESVLARSAEQADTEPERLSIAFTRTLNMFWGAANTAGALEIIDRARTGLSDRGMRALDVMEGTIRVASGELRPGLSLLEDLQEELDPPYRDFSVFGMIFKSTGCLNTGQPLLARRISEQAYKHHLRSDQDTLTCHPAVQLAFAVQALAQAGQLSEARKRGEQAFAELVEARAPSRVWAALHLARAEWLAGRVATARRWFAEAAGLARAQHQLPTLRLALSGLAASAAVQGDLDAADAATTECERLPAQWCYAGEDSLGAAWTLAARGQLTNARGVLLAAAATARDMGHVTAELQLLTDVARLGDPRSVGDRVAELARRSDGPLSSARAQFVTALNARAPAGLMVAAAALESAGAQLMAAESAATAAGEWIRAGQRRQATEAAKAARRLAAACEGARTPALATLSTTSQLTVRERETALLAAQGMSSKEIATTLSLSARTVNNHLHRVYAKLGVTTRRELGRALDGG